MYKIPIEIVRNLVDSKPKSKEFEFWDKISVVLIVSIIFVPMLIIPVLTFVFKFELAFYLIFPFYLLSIFLFGKWNRGRVYREFFKINHGEKNFKIIELDDESHLIELKNRSALTCIGEPTDEWLNLIYNWLYFFNAIDKDKIVTIYTYKGSLLKSTFKEDRVSSDESYFTIEPNDYNPPEDEKSVFYRTHFNVGCRYLDDILTF